MKLYSGVLDAYLGLHKDFKTLPWIKSLLERWFSMSWKSVDCAVQSSWILCIFWSCGLDSRGSTGTPESDSRVDDPLVFFLVFFGLSWSDVGVDRFSLVFDKADCSIDDFTICRLQLFTSVRSLSRLRLLLLGGSLFYDPQDDRDE